MTLTKLALFVTLVFSPLLALAQGGEVIGIAQYNQTGYARIISGATVTICTYTGSLSCGVPLTTYSDEALTVPNASVVSDANGNYNFFITPGSYVVSVAAPGFTTFLQKVTVAVTTSSLVTAPLVINNATVNGVCDLASYVGDLGSKLTLALADTNCVTGINDGSSVTGAIGLTGVSVTKPYTKNIFGPVNVTTANTITVPVGVNGVWLAGTTAWGSDGSNMGNGGSYFTYSGTGTFLGVGDATNPTYFPKVSDIAIHLTGAGSTGIAFKRVLFGALDRIRVGCPVSNTSTGVSLDGTGDYGGFVKIEQPYISNCKTGLNITGGAGGFQPITVIGGDITGPNAAVGSVGVNVNLNPGDSFSMLGTNVQNWATGLAIKSNQNIIPMVRLEGNTTDIHFITPAEYNLVFTDKIDPVVTDDTGLNSVWPLSKIIVKPTGDVTWLTQLDQPLTFNMRAGATANQDIRFNFRDRNAVTHFTMWPYIASSDSFNISDASLSRFSLINGGSMNFNAAGSSQIQFNATANSSTGGIHFFSGGASPTDVASISTTGAGTFNGGVKIGTTGTLLTGYQFLSTGTGTLTAGTRTEVLLTLPNGGFGDTNYVTVCNVLDSTTLGNAAGLTLERQRTKNNTQLGVVIYNPTGGDLSGTVNCYFGHTS